MYPSNSLEAIMLAQKYRDISRVIVSAMTMRSPSKTINAFPKSFGFETIQFDRTRRIRAIRGTGSRRNYSLLLPLSLSHVSGRGTRSRHTHTSCGKTERRGQTAGEFSDTEENLLFRRV